MYHKNDDFETFLVIFWIIIFFIILLICLIYPFLPCSFQSYFSKIQDLPARCQIEYSDQILKKIIINEKS